MKQTEYGYARETSKDKKAHEQLTALYEAGISPENIFVDQPAERDKLDQLMKCIKPNDLLVIKSLSQLGYNYQEILNEWKELSDELKANIRVLDTPLLDTSNKMKRVSSSFISDLFLQIVTFAAQLERAYIKRRQAEGIAYAKSQGRHLGRPRIPKPIHFNEVYDQWRSGGVSAEEAMIRLSLKRSTFERFVKERKIELKKETEQKAS